MRVRTRACVRVPRVTGGQGRSTGDGGEDGQLPCSLDGQSPDTLSYWPEPKKLATALPFRQECLQSCYCFLR